MTKDIPNIFSYATSELSQDAMIAWLLQWASPEYGEADPDLHRTGVYCHRKVNSFATEK